MIRSTYVHSTWYMSQCPFLLHFSHGPILVQINQAQPFHMHSFIYLTQTNLYVEHHTEKQLVDLTRPRGVRTLDLQNSKRTLYH